MKYFIDRSSTEVFAFEADGSQDEFIGPELEPLSDTELAAILAASVDPVVQILDQIAALEAKVTPRRLREAVLSGDHEFIRSIDEQIAALRERLPKEPQPV